MLPQKQKCLKLYCSIVLQNVNKVKSFYYISTFLSSEQRFVGNIRFPTVPFKLFDFNCGFKRI